ncbi:MAG TPA: molybdenum cofactor biosynthesis protein MoaE [Allosphingosinicella sp.]|nr:molybdenum cofactor biosynthesis protein MoaE [Allosphingosinicella sp.]
MIDVRVQTGDFDPGRQIERLRGLGAAAIVGSLAIIEAGADVQEVRVEHYPAMAKAELARIAGEAAKQWPLGGIVVVHRYGRFAPGARLLLIGVAAARHGAALEAVAYLQRAIRARAPFWRKDLLAGGGSRWVGPAETD